MCAVSENAQVNLKVNKKTHAVPVLGNERGVPWGGLVGWGGGGGGGLQHSCTNSAPSQCRTNALRSITHFSIECYVNQMLVT